MARTIAQFTTSSNKPEYYPQTPFQVLYQDPKTAGGSLIDGGYYATGSNTFTVTTGTSFYVPVWSADDSPPIVGTWPTTHCPAVNYFFGPSQVGAKGLQITVDGKTTRLGPAYLAGPVTTKPLLDGGGTHIITVGAFLSPLSTGKHTVSISGGVYGTETAKTYLPLLGFTFMVENISYAVTVQP